MLDRWRHELGGGLPRSFWVLWTGMAINRAGCFVVPFMALYLTQARGFSVARAGAVAAAYGLGTMVASPLGGYCADHFGRRVTLVGALVTGGLGMIALSFAQRFDLILPGCFLVAMLGEAYRPAMQAAVADLVAPEHRVRAFGLVYWVINLGYSVGLSLGGFLASRSFRWLFVGDGLTSIIFGLLVWRAVPETHSAQHAKEARAHGVVSGFLAPYRDRPFLAFLFLTVSILLVFTQHVAALPLDITSHGVSRGTLGLVLSINGILIVLVQPFLAPIVSRRNRSRVLAVGAATVGAGFGLNAMATAAPLFAIATAIWTVGEICVLPIGNAVVADIARPELRGRYQGAYGLCFGLAAFGAPLIGTFVMERWGGNTLWAGCLAMALLVSAGHLALAPRLTRLSEARMAGPR